jgi:hypothetical protein
MPWKHMRKWMYSSIILDLGTRWRWVGSFMPQPLYHQGKSPWYPLDRRLSRPQCWSGCCGVEKKSLARARNRTPAIQPVADHYTDWAILAQSYMYIINNNIGDRFSPSIFVSPANSHSTNCTRSINNLTLYRLDTGSDKKGKAIPVTGRVCPQGCVALRLPHFL